jgi:hypothetical protein
MDTTTLYVFTGVAALATGFATWRYGRAAPLQGAHTGAAQPLAAMAASATKSLSRIERSSDPSASAPQPAAGLATGGAVQALAGAARRGDTTALQLSALQPPARRAAVNAQPMAPGANVGGALYIGSVNLSPPPAAPRPAPQTGAHGSRPGGKRPAIETRTPQALGDDFMQWLRECMAARTLPYNTLQAAVHFLPEGMVLVCPAIFLAYLSTCAVAAPKPGSPTLMLPSTGRDKTLMKAVCDLGWHERGVLDSNLLHFQLLRPGTAPLIMKGLLIPAPERFIDFVPRANPALSRLI